MKETPIMFTPEHVRAILDGKKTQTRRLVRPQPIAWRPTECEGAYEWRYSRTSAAVFGDIDGILVHCPYGVRSDLLWVREAWALVPVTAYRASEGVQQTPSPIDPHDAAVYKAGWTLSSPTKWRHAMYMPRWASRLTLRITEVRVERLRDISEADARAEGVTREANGPRMYPSARAARTLESYADAYARIWDEINGTRAPWASNPWVWAITFEVV